MWSGTDYKKVQLWSLVPMVLARHRSVDSDDANDFLHDRIFVANRCIKCNTVPDLPISDFSPLSSHSLCITFPTENHFRNLHSSFELLPPRRFGSTPSETRRVASSHTSVVVVVVVVWFPSSSSSSSSVRVVMTQMAWKLYKECQR